MSPPDGVSSLSGTATYYEILGVESDASHEVCKRAYLDRALRWHPDRQPDDPAVRERAEFRMRELNEAWRVLQSPGRRADYDRSLGRSAPTARAGTGWAGTGPMPGPIPEATPVAAPDGVGSRRTVVAPRDGSLGLAPYLPLLVLGGILAAIFVFTAFAKPGAPGDDVDLSTTARFPRGACVRVYVDGDADVVPCTEPSSGRVAGTATVPLTCPADTVAVSLPGGKDLLCLERSTATGG